MRIVLGTSTLAGYPQGGGHWSVRLQYLRGLCSLGHSPFLIDCYTRTASPAADRRRFDVFFARMRNWGFGEACCIVVFRKDETTLSIESCEVIGIAKERLRSVIWGADLLLNLHGSLPPALTPGFKRRALLDLDPGHLQIGALSWEFGLHDHEVFFSVGTKMADDDCEAPRLGHHWHPFVPPIHLPSWRVAPLPEPEAPITSVTQWSWGSQLRFGNRALNSSKRSAYLRFLDLPAQCAAPLTLAANLDPRDTTGDREMLLRHGWNLVHPHHCMRTVEAYQRFIHGSKAEIGCAKNVFIELKTGWFSDRSAAYLASGRPVIAEDTGFSDHLPTGLGLLSFTTIDEAAAAVDDLLTNYPQHQKAARELAESYFDASRVLPNLIELCSS